MTAPKTLPGCKVCGRSPKAKQRPWGDPEYAFLRLCFKKTLRGYHEVVFYGRTQAEADARWRRMGGKK